MTHADLHQISRALRESPSLLLMTHEHPDCDAIGSLVATHRILAAAGISAPMLILEGDDPASELRFMVPWDHVVREVPGEASDHTFVMLDCGNLERSPARESGHLAAAVINIDHHHDNTGFGSLNHVEPDASCTAEIVWRLARHLGVEIDTPTAIALYVGLVTDTGRFMYDNTGSEAHLMAADLISRGVRVADLFRRIYEGVPEGQARLLGRALSKLERHEGGRLTLVWLTRSDFEDCNAFDGWAEGIVDHLRAIDGTEVAAVIREPSSDPELRRISLRASIDSVDVSRIARQGGGGGHRGAAGFSSNLDRELLVAFLIEQMSAQPAA